MKNSEIKKLKRFYKFYVGALVFVLLYSIASYFWTMPFLSVEFIVGVVFLSLLGSIVYLGSMIIELDRRLEKIENTEND